jgi:hypothetical protein
MRQRHEYAQNNRVNRPATCSDDVGGGDRLAMPRSRGVHHASPEARYHVKQRLIHFGFISCPLAFVLPFQAWSVAPPETVPRYFIDPSLTCYYRKLIDGESVGAGPLGLSRSTLLLLSGVIAALLAIVALSLQREAASVPAPRPAHTMTEAAPIAPPPLTAEEEAFAEALWPLHQQFVEASAGRLSFAGLAYALDDHDPRRLAEKLASLLQVFHDTETKVAAINAPPSLRQLQDRYTQMLALYEASATEMLEVTRDGDSKHLINAQRKSEHAAEELVKVGDILWPGEHKPN